MGEFCLEFILYFATKDETLGPTTHVVPEVGLEVTTAHQVTSFIEAAVLRGQC